MSKVNFTGGIKMKSFLVISILAVLVLSIFSSVFVLAEDDESDDQEQDVDKSLVVLRPFTSLAGYAENENGEDARHIRLWIGKAKTFVLTQEIVDQVKEIREQYKDDPETMREKLKELAQEYKENSENDSYQGVLVIGKGKDHQMYGLVSKEVNNESATFYILEKKVVSENSTSVKPEKKGFFWGLGKRLGFIKNQVITEPVNEDNVNVIGEISIDSEKFETITLWKGTMELDSGNYEGSWDVDLMSASSLKWPNPGQHKAFALGQQKDKNKFEESED